jgi:hypothetical protein
MSDTEPCPSPTWRSTVWPIHTQMRLLNIYVIHGKHMHRSLSISQMRKLRHRESWPGTANGHINEAKRVVSGNYKSDSYQPLPGTLSYTTYTHACMGAHKHTCTHMQIQVQCTCTKKASLLSTPLPFLDSLGPCRRKRGGGVGKGRWYLWEPSNTHSRLPLGRR